MKKLTALMILMFLSTLICEANIKQGNYRWRSDTVGESSNSGWLASENTNITGVSTGTNIRLRAEVYNDDGDASTSLHVLKIFYSTSSDPTTGSWTQITTSSAAFQLSLTSYYNDMDDADTDLLNESAGTAQSTTGASGQGIGPHAIESSEESGEINIPSSSSYEMEYCIKATSSAVAGETYYFKFNKTMVSNSSEGDLDGYSSLPAVTIQSDIAFTDGSSFTPSVSPGSSDQAIGCFQLNGNISGSTLSSVVIKLDGTRTGLSNLKLWESSDASFGSDTQLGSTVAVDPGDGNTVTFSSLSASITTAGKYYFLSGDIASGATGSVEGIIVNNSSLSINSGTLTGTITNASLSSGTSTLPVELILFTASLPGNSVVLNWQTATELNNYGFEVERQETSVSGQESGWETIGFAAGHGNSSSPKYYEFVDENPPAGELEYRLRQIDTDGSYVYYGQTAIVINSITGLEIETELPTEFSLSQNYPNPFNPSTTIKYSVPISLPMLPGRDGEGLKAPTSRGDFAKVQLVIYDMLGREVSTLVNEHQNPGNYTVEFDGSELTSGVYFYRIDIGQYKGVRKMILLK